MLLSGLDQFSRARLPGYTGYKPQGGEGATAEQPAHGPTDATVQGFVNREVSESAGAACHLVGRTGVGRT